MRVISLIFFLGFSTVLFAQLEYTSKSKKAIKDFEAAQSAMTIDSLNQAMDLANKAIEKDPLFAEAFLLRSYIYADKKEFYKAISDVESAIRLNKDFFPPMYLDLGGLYFETQQFDKSKEVLQNYIDKFNPSEKFKPKAERIIKNCDFSKWAMAHPVPFNPENVGAEINSKYKDYNSYISVDGEVFMITRTIPDDRAYMKAQEDFYVSYKSGDKWTVAANLGTPINTYVNEGAPTLSADGRLMILTVVEEFGFYGEGREGLGRGDLFYSVKKGDRWSPPKNLGFKINSKANDTQPSLSSDGKDLYFASNRSGGYGEADLYVSHLTNEGFSIPVNLGPKINTAGLEDGVFIHPDNQTLYFSSNGQVGLGNRDIYMCKRNQDGSWGDPVNLGYPINTNGTERSIFIDAQGDFAYFSSDRPGGVGDLDIYRFKMPQSAKPTPVTYMKGIVYDEKTKKPLGAAFELIDLETGKQLVESFSDAKDGSFLVCLPVGKNYALKVSCEGGYLFYSENFELTNPKKGEDAFRKDVPMKKIGPGEKVVLKNVFFATDSYELKPESKTELDNLVAFLNKNATMKIELGGHTDNQGAKAHNKTLSQNRANAVKDYLINHGITADRLTAKGYADEVPVDSNDTESGRANNRRTEFMVVQ